MLNDGNAISTAAACVANSARVECTAIQLETQSVIGWTEQLLVALTVGDMLLGFAIKEARAGRLNELMMSFEGKVGQMVGLVASSTTELHTTAEGMSGIAGRTNQHSATVASVAAEASVNIASDRRRGHPGSRCCRRIVPAGGTVEGRGRSVHPRRKGGLTAIECPHRPTSGPGSRKGQRRLVGRCNAPNAGSGRCLARGMGETRSRTLCPLRLGRGGPQVSLSAQSEGDSPVI